VKTNQQVVPECCFMCHTKIFPHELKRASLVKYRQQRRVQERKRDSCDNTSKPEIKTRQVFRQLQ